MAFPDSHEGFTRIFVIAFILITIAVLLPIITSLVAFMMMPGHMANATRIGGAVIIFPLVPIPIVFTFGNPNIPQWLLWLVYALFLLFLALFILAVIMAIKRRHAVAS